MSDLCVKTKYGIVEGKISDRDPNVLVWKGIPYAKAKRFGYPEEYVLPEEGFKADAFGACCYQKRSFYPEAADPKKYFYYHEFRENENFTYDEQCLNLNIWAPKDAKGLPVLFYIHGGSYTTGSSSEKPFKGEAWCNKGVIVVTINYRLNVFGFFCHAELEKRDGHSGNYALYDQEAALRWVHDNIEAFGGDSGKITLMGQSAGAISVQQFCNSSKVDGLFQSAIMLSGGGVGSILDTGVKKQERIYPFFEAVMKFAGADSIEKLLQVSPKVLFCAYQRACKEVSGSFDAIWPYRDGIFLTESGSTTARRRKEKQIPYITCTTKNDVATPIFKARARKWSKVTASHGNQASYCAYFDHDLPGDKKGAWHSSDLWYAFGTMDLCWRPFTEEDRRISEQMICYYSNFVKSGNPNGEGLPHWSSVYEKRSSVMVFK